MIDKSCPNQACPQGIDTPAKIVRHGSFTVRCGRCRRYQCLGCGCTFSRRINFAYSGLRCSSRVFERVAQLSVEGMSCSAIARVENVAWHTVDRWLNKAARSPSNSTITTFEASRSSSFKPTSSGRLHPGRPDPSGSSPVWRYARGFGHRRSWDGAVTAIRSSYSTTHSLAVRSLGHR